MHPASPHRPSLRTPALVLALITAFVAGCDRSPTSNTPDADHITQPPNPPDREQLERLAQRVARTLADPAFRREL